VVGDATSFPGRVVEASRRVVDGGRAGQCVFQARQRKKSRRRQ
jgi:hypothetical protein